MSAFVAPILSARTARLVVMFRGVRLELVEVTGAGQNDDLVRAAFDSILEPSFSANELPSIEMITEGWEVDPYHLLLVALADGGPLGAAVYSEGGTGLGTLDYLAARPGARNRGVGSALMGRLASIWSGRPVIAVLAEVHDPRFYSDGPDEQPAARVRFYERHGAQLLGVPWVQPRLSAIGRRVHNMLLLQLLAGGGPSLPSAALREWVTGYYLSTEGVVPTDQTFVALWERVLASDAIEVLPIEGLGVVPLGPVDGRPAI